MNISELSDEMKEHINIVNECDVYDYIRIPKNDIDERVEILGKEFRKEQRIQILGKIKHELRKLFASYATKLEENDLPLPTSIEFNYHREYDDSLHVKSFTLYDSEDRSFDNQECWRVDMWMTDRICDIAYSAVDTELLMKYTDWEGYRIIFGDLNNN